MSANDSDAMSIMVIRINDVISFFISGPRYDLYKADNSPGDNPEYSHDGEKIVEWLESNLQSCFYKKYLGVECPGCGMQRAFIELLKGNLWESFLLFPALIPTIVLVIYLFLHISFKFKNGANILKFLFIINTSIVVLSYIYKLLT